MKRREFLGYTGLGALGVATSPILSGCSEEQPTVKFWQNGNFKPVSEEVTETNLKIEGNIPPELNGLYVRNGTNSSTGISEHFFGGDGNDARRSPRRWASQVVSQPLYRYACLPQGERWFWRAQA